MSTLPLEDTGRFPSMSSVHDAPGSVQESPCRTATYVGPFRAISGAASPAVELAGMVGAAGTTSMSNWAVSAWPALSVQVYVMV